MWSDNPMSEAEHELIDEAERELIETVRDPDMDDFAFTITREGNRWHLQYFCWTTDTTESAHGFSFGEAWREMANREDDEPSTLNDPWTLPHRGETDAKTL
jgi:hypothetical protein